LLIRIKTAILKFGYNNPMWYPYSFLPSPLTLRYVPFNPVLFHDPHTAVPPYLCKYITAHCSFYPPYLCRHEIFSWRGSKVPIMGYLTQAGWWASAAAAGSEVECHVICFLKNIDFQMKTPSR
jgi:hypothetical protein